MSNFTNQFQSYSLPFFENGVRWPETIIKDEDKIKVGLRASSSNIEYLKKRAWQGCSNKIKNGIIKQSKQECIDRLKI